MDMAQHMGPSTGSGVGGNGSGCSGCVPPPSLTAGQGGTVAFAAFNAKAFSNARLNTPHGSSSTSSAAVPNVTPIPLRAASGAGTAAAALHSLSSVGSGAREGVGSRRRRVRARGGAGLRMTAQQQQEEKVDTRTTKKAGGGVAGVVSRIAAFGPQGTESILTRVALR